MRISNLSTTIGRILDARAKKVRAVASALAILAGGLTFVGPAPAVELLSNGSFEQNNGFGGNNSGFSWQNTDDSDVFNVYNHTTQVYYDGPAPTGADDWYFHTVSITNPNGVWQDVTLPGGSEDTYRLSAFLSGGNFNDAAVLQLEFDDPGSTVVTVDGAQPNGTNDNVDGSSPRNFGAWGFYSATGLIPDGATGGTVRVLQSTALGGNGNDNYVDLISLDVFVGPKITVNKLLGTMILDNESTDDIVLRGYQLTSATGDLNVTGWTSWDDLGLDGDTWSEANPSANQLAELNLTSSGTIAAGTTRSLGKAYGGGLGGAENLVFRYLPVGSTAQIEIPVSYDDTLPVGDLNFDTVINSADWLLFIAGSGVDLSGLTMVQAFQMGDMDDDLDNDYDDFVLFKQAYEAANPGSSFDAMVASVPEPGSLVLLGFGFALLLAKRRR